MTIADHRASLERLRDALGTGGRLAFDVFVPSFDAICETYGTPRTRRTEHEGVEFHVYDITRIEDEVEQVAEVTRRIERDGEGLAERSFLLALLSKRQIDLFLELTGWSGWQGYGGFGYEPLADGPVGMVWIAER